MTDTLDSLRSDWQSVARYSVYRTQIGTSKVLLHSDLPYAAAKEAVEIEDAQIRSEPGYRGHIMDRPKALMQLESPDATTEKFRDLRAARGET